MLKMLLLLQTLGWNSPETVFALENREEFLVNLKRIGGDILWVAINNINSDGWPTIRIDPYQDTIEEWQEFINDLSVTNVHTIYVLPCQVENNDDYPFDRNELLLQEEIDLYQWIEEATRGINRIWLVGGEEANWPARKMREHARHLKLLDPTGETTIHNSLGGVGFLVLYANLNNEFIDRFSLQTNKDAPIEMWRQASRDAGYERKIDLAELWNDGQGIPKDEDSGVEISRQVLFDAINQGADSIQIWAGCCDITTRTTLEPWEDTYRLMEIERNPIKEISDYLLGIDTNPLGLDRNKDGAIDSADIIWEGSRHVD